MKPRGLWYSVNGDWERWCRDNEPSWIENKILYSVDLQQANILRINNAKELLVFHKRVAIPPVLQAPAIKYPAWEAVAGAGYDGIEISPYIWSLPLHHELTWYYGWDCASGCVWNATKITVTEL